MLSKKFLLFDTELHDVATYVGEHRVALQLSEAVLKHLESDVATWDATFVLYKDDSKRTLAVIHQVHDNYDTISAYVHNLQQSIKRNPDLDLTDEDYTGLHIHRDKPRRGHIPKPEAAPQLQLVLTSHLRNGFEINDADYRDHRGFPPDVAGAGRKLAVVSAGVSPTAGDYVVLGNTGRTTFRINFEPSQVGKEGHLIVWYLNERGEKGPESAPLKFIII